MERKKSLLETINNIRRRKREEVDEKEEHKDVCLLASLVRRR